MESMVELYSATSSGAEERNGKPPVAICTILEYHCWIPCRGKLRTVVRCVRKYVKEIKGMRKQMHGLSTVNKKKRAIEVEKETGQKARISVRN